jgi:hypothetical protein
MDTIATLTAKYYKALSNASSCDGLNDRVTQIECLLEEATYADSLGNSVWRDEILTFTYRKF